MTQSKIKQPSFLKKDYTKVAESSDEEEEKKVSEIEFKPKLEASQSSEDDQPQRLKKREEKAKLKE